MLEKKNQYMCVGKTRSGKPIYEPGIDDEPTLFILETQKTFTIDEVFDAFSVYDYLAQREYRRSGERTERFYLYAKLIDKLKEIKLQTSLEKCRINAGLKGLADIHRHAINCVNIEFRD